MSLLQYFLKEKARPTEDLDIIIPGDIDLFRDTLEKALSDIKGPLSFKITNFKKNYADTKYYYDTFNIQIDVFYKDEKYSQVVVDAISSPIFNEIDPVQYQGPEITTTNYLFNGVPIEYVMAEKVIAVTNELKRPFKHLVVLFSLIQLDINVGLLRKFVTLINDNDNQVRNKLNIATSNVYQIDFNEMKEAINNWFKTNLK